MKRLGMMKYRRKHFSLISIVIWGFLWSLSSDDTVPDKNMDSIHGLSRTDYRQIIRKLHKLDYNLRFEGEIVDPDGMIISDVKVLSSKSKDVMSNSCDKDVFIVKDGNFAFDAKDIFTWGLTFEKEVYYKTVIPLGVAQISSAIGRGDKSFTIHDDFILKRAKVVLFPYGKMNPDLLEVDDNILTFSDNGENKVIKCVVIPYMDGKRHREENESEFTFSDEKKLPGSLIYIVPGYKPDGSHDGTIRLKTSGKDSGFLPVKYDGPHCFRSMWEAPEKGDYKPELIIEDGLQNYLQHNYVKPKAVGNMHLAGVSKSVPKTVPYTIFYFRVNGYYGKGLIMPGDAGGDSYLKETQASLRVYLYVNRKPGIRNTNVWLGTDW